MMPIYDRVLITGAGGMLARALIRALRSRGIEPVALDRAALDITDLDQVRAAFDSSPTLVLNSAAYTKVDLAETERDRAMAVNGEALKNLSRFAQLHRAALVHFSTDYVFDGTLTRPLRPDDRIGPRSAYGASKRRGEEWVLTTGPDRSLVIRTAWLYGPGGPNFVQTMLNAARAGKPLKVVNDQTGSPTFTHDLADATLNLIDADARGVYHVTNFGQTTWFDFTRAILDEFNVSAEVSPTTSAEWKKIRPNSAERPAYSVLDCSEYQRVTGKSLPDWRDALHRYRLAIEHG